MSVEVAKRAPGGPGGKVGRSFHAVGQAVVSSFRGAKALDVGAYIVPKKRQTKSGRRPMLRFQGEGGVVFRPSARIPAHHYIRSALRRRRSVVDSAVRRVYGDLLG